MDQFADKIAVITGGGTGIGRELAVQLAAAGCHLALCDVSADHLTETKARCGDRVRVTTFVADVSDELQVLAFRDAVVREHPCVHLVFANAGIAGSGSFVTDSRVDWDRTFAVCWNGVYYTARAFVPLLIAAPEGHLVNTASVCGFWASLGPRSALSAYSSAKFAVKGFSEALVNDFRVNAPHVAVSVVMPGHVGTSLVANSASQLGRDPADDAGFREHALTTAEHAATLILDGVREKRWRILVGRDAEVLDRLVRAAPEQAYTEAFMDELRAETRWTLGD